MRTAAIRESRQRGAPPQCKICTSCLMGLNSANVSASTSVQRAPAQASTSVQRASAVETKALKKKSGKPRGTEFKMSQKENSVSLPILPGNLKKIRCNTLRTIISAMVKSTTGRKKIGFGIADKMPTWWPEDILPWKSITTDARTPEMKSMMSWPNALRHVIKCCYIYFDREDILKQWKSGRNDARKAITESTSFRYSVQQRMVIDMFSKASLNANGQVEKQADKINQVSRAITNKVEKIETNNLRNEILFHHLNFDEDDMDDAAPTLEFSTETAEVL